MTPAPHTAFAFNLARTGRINEILLPPPGEVVGPHDTDPVRLYANSSEPRAGHIVSAAVRPDELSRYLSATDLVGQKVQPNAQTELTGLRLENPDNPPPEVRLRGRLELSVRFNEDATVGAVLVAVPFELVRFPDWPGIFAIDFGNTSTTCVVLPSTARLFGDPDFRCLNWVQPEEPGDPLPTAIRFDAFSPDGRSVTRWDVGQEVVQEHRALIAEKSVSALTRYDGFRIGGIKRQLAKTEANVRTVGSRDGQPGPTLTGNQLNALALRKFIRRSEECQDAAQRAPVGTFRRVIATRPVNFNPLELEAMRELYAQILRTQDVEVRYDEATAAAIYYLVKQLHGEGRDLSAGMHQFWARTDDPAAPPAGGADTHVFNMLVFDCGGGTTDIALMRVLVDRRTWVSPESGFTTDNWFEVRPTVYGLTGLKNFAGDNMTLAALRLIRFKFALALAAATPVEVNADVWPAGGGGDAEGFANSLQHLRRRLEVGLPKDAAGVAALVVELDAHCRRVVPTDFGRHRENPGGRGYALRLDLFYQLWETAEQLKRQLCRKDEERVALPSGVTAAYRAGGNAALTIQDVTVSRAELDALLGDPVRRAWELAADLCKDLPEGEKVHQVVLAGNGCRYPLVRTLLREAFVKAAGGRFEYREGLILFEPEDAKLACAKGAAIAERFRLGRPKDIDEPDQNIVAIHPDSVSRLPFPYLFMTLGGKEEVFPRGLIIPDGQKHAKERRAYQPEFQIFQGLRKDDPDSAVGFCQFRCEGAEVQQPPPELPGAAFANVEFQVDRLHELSAFAVWAKDGREVLVPLAREPLPEPPDVRQNNPFEGLN